MSYIKFLVAVWLVVGLSACASAPTTPQARQDTVAALPVVSPSSSLPATTHTVAAGETLWRIARMYQTDPEEIARFNKIQDSTIISAGQRLVIPGGQRKKITPASNFTAGGGTEDFIWPIKGHITAYFRQKTRGANNKGIDISTRDTQNIMASRDGRVVFIGKLTGYGQTIILDHKDGLRTVYCGYATSSVKLGDEVKQGTVLAKAGNVSGKDTDSLHFEIRRKHRPQNPLFYLD
ncbi:LysM peptidoglycan-binding domain-containing M23 family metallopeptidase [Candidatus Velamenicoccus archaeovorus]|uniref:LysM peptidoglycan-binding domain-containing M23 family metallopeptidase n=1 Tax=Velamenicoccus archaeovorus TaxID=1930593 RepID=UPI000FFE8ECC|nr:LysM peptidoglycan-binding domain-containing M23 family metallopeptidase [Candidatus Velamenicoccus archaeovorus]